MKKKKIVFVTKALWIGGIETALVNLLNYFDYEKYDVTLLVICAELDKLEQINPKCRVLIADREQIFSFKEKYKYKRLYHLTENAENPSAIHKMMMWSVPVIRWIENRLYIRYIRKQMVNEKFDTAVIYSDVAGETAIRAIKADKYLMFYHHGSMRRVYHDEIAYRKCEKIIAVSENQAEELKKFVPKYKDKITAIHNLIDIKGIREKGSQRCDDLFDISKINIVSVGRVSREKGMDIAVQVCAKLVKDGFTNIKWWIVGDGPDMQNVKAAVEKCNMEDYINLVGMKSNPYPYIRQADLYVQPSRFEGYPMTILEALVLGKPVISSDNNGAREILKNGVTGLLLPLDTDEIAKKLGWLIKSSSSMTELNENVRKLDFERVNAEIIRQIEGCL